MQGAWAVVCLLFVTSSAAAAPAFQKQPVPPRVFDGIRAGTPIADAASALATFAPDPTYRDAANRVRLVKDAGHGAKYYVLVKHEVVSRIGIEAPARGLEARLVRLWGDPVRTKNLADEVLTSWSGAGWRADLSCRESLCRMAFHQPLTAAFFGNAAAAPGVLASLRPGTPRDAIAKLAPRHLSNDIPAGPEDVRITLDFETTYLASVVIGGLPANTRPLLDAAWGQALVSDRGPVWFNPALGWRAVYLESLQSVHLTPYMPAAKLLGAGPGIAVLAKPILGATREQITAAYPQFRADNKTLRLALPPMEGGTGAVTASFDPKTRRVNRLSIELPFDTTARRDELVQLMTAKWGKPTQKANVLAFPTGKLRIEARDTGSRLELLLSL